MLSELPYGQHMDSIDWNPQQGGAVSLVRQGLVGDMLGCSESYNLFSIKILGGVKRLFPIGSCN